MLKWIFALALSTSVITLSVHNFDPLCFCPSGFTQKQDQMICVKDCLAGHSKVQGQTKCFRNCPVIEGVSTENKNCVFTSFGRKYFEGSTPAEALKKCINAIGKMNCQQVQGRAFAKCPSGYTTTISQCQPKKVNCELNGLIKTSKENVCMRKGKDFETSPIMCA